MPQEFDQYESPALAESARHVQLPNDIEAEQAVLASCLLNEDACYEISINLKSEQFYRISHQLIFSAILQMVKQGLRADVISLADKLQAQGDLDKAGGRAYLTDLNGNTFALTNWRHHMEIVKRTAIQRDLIRAAAEINALAYNAPDDLNEVVESAEQSLFKVTEKRVSSSFRKIDSLVDEAYSELSRIASQGNKMIGVPTGFKDVDSLFHGFRGGDLIVLAARPGVGKTAFALNLAVNAAKENVSVAFFSLEMSSSQLVQRLISSEAMVDLGKLRSGNVGEGDWGQIADASGRLSALDMFIDDTPGLSIMEARAKARRELRNVVGTDKKGLIIVDYLQLMQAPATRRDSNRTVEVGEISRGLKILAKEMDMPVIALAQLNRGVEMRGKKRPMLSDLRESGSIEQDADIVMFIDRSMDEVEAEDANRPDLGVATLIVAKHRNGPLKDITMAFNPNLTKFGDFFDASRYEG